jgi:hypothetical protein
MHQPLPQVNAGSAKAGQAATYQAAAAAFGYQAAEDSCGTQHQVAI